MSSGAIAGRTRFFLTAGGITGIHIFCYCAKVNRYPGRLQPLFSNSREKSFFEPLRLPQRIRRQHHNGFGPEQTLSIQGAPTPDAGGCPSLLRSYKIDSQVIDPK
jgi:hypothetical protein